MDAAQAWGRPRERAREGRERPLLQAAALALHPRPRGRPRRKRAPLRCQSCHETRTPGWGKAFGPVLRVSSEKGLGDSVFRCFPASSRKKAPPSGWVYRLPPHGAKAGVSGAKRGVASRILFPLLVRYLGKGDKHHPFRC